MISLVGTAATAAGDGTSNSFSNRVFVEKVSGKLCLTNNSEIPCEVKIMVLKCRKDSNVSPKFAWGNGLDNNRIIGD